jgi:hypothetical protein
MAAVTITARSRKIHNLGSTNGAQWNITGNDTNTLDTGLKSNYTWQVYMEPNNIVTAVAQSTVNGQIRLTFSATGAFAGIDLLMVRR